MRRYMGLALELQPHAVIDDGGDLVELLHESHREHAAAMLGACEETTSGVLRARARAAAGRLRFPVVLVNDARCKYLFDNVHGTGQSVWEGVMRATNLLLAGKTVAIVGYGWCGKGCALRAQGLGAHVVVCEVDPIKAADALMHGCRVLPLAEACRSRTSCSRSPAFGTRCVPSTSSGSRTTSARECRPLLGGDRRGGASRRAVERKRLRADVEGFRLRDGRWLNLLGGGNIVNISCGDGHPPRSWT